MKMASSPIDSLMNRSKAYYNIDGVGELGIGFMLLGYGLLAWLQSHSPTTGIANSMYFFIAYMIAMLSAIHYGSNAIKNRITYRRTGYVEYRNRDRRWIPMALGASVSALFSVGLYIALRRHWEINASGALVGLFFAAAYTRIAMTVRWKWAVSVVLVAATLVISALPADALAMLVNNRGFTKAVPAKFIGAYWLTAVVFGVALAISGGISFWLYLRRTRRPGEEAQ